MSLEKKIKAETAPVTGAVEAVEEIVKETAEAIVEETIEEVVEETIEETAEETVEETVEETTLNPTQLRQLAAKEAQASQRKKQAKKEAAEAKAEEATKKAEEKASKEVEKDDRKVFTDDRGLKFRFKTTAPKSLNIDGQSRLVSELIDEAEVMLELVHGNNSFIENIQ